MRDEAQAIIPRDPKRGKAIAVAIALRGIAADMTGVSVELEKLDRIGAVNACKLRGQASLIREWAKQIEESDRWARFDDSAEAIKRYRRVVDER